MHDKGYPWNSEKYKKIGKGLTSKPKLTSQIGQILGPIQGIDKMYTAMPCNKIAEKKCPLEPRFARMDPTHLKRNRSELHISLRLTNLGKLMIDLS